MWQERRHSRRQCICLHTYVCMSHVHLYYRQNEPNPHPSPHIARRLCYRCVCLLFLVFFFLLFFLSHALHNGLLYIYYLSPEERVQDIAFWKDELLKESRLMDNEIDNLEVE